MVAIAGLGVPIAAGVARAAPAIARTVAPNLTRRAGNWLMDNKWKSGLGASLAGLLGYEMLRPEEEEKKVVTGGEGPGTGFETRDRSTIPDDWRSALGDTTAAQAKQSALNLKRLKQVMMRGAILKAHNPHAKDNYVKNALEVLKAEALQRNDMQQARIIDNIKNKDGSIPDDAKLIYDRIIKSGGSPQFAAEISGHQLKIERTQAQAAKDYMAGQPQLSDMMTKEMMELSRLKAQYDSGDTQNAIAILASRLKTGQIDISDRYGDLQIKTDAEMYELAAQILKGRTDLKLPTEDDIKIEER
jgi:hypothetical protein